MNLTFTSDFWTKKLTFDKGATVFVNDNGIQVGNDKSSLKQISRVVNQAIATKKIFYPKLLIENLERLNSKIKAHNQNVSNSGWLSFLSFISCGSLNWKIEEIQFHKIFNPGFSVANKEETDRKSPLTLHKDVSKPAIQANNQRITKEQLRLPPVVIRDRNQRNLASILTVGSLDYLPLKDLVIFARSTCAFNDLIAQSCKNRLKIIFKDAKTLNDELKTLLPSHSLIGTRGKESWLYNICKFDLNKWNEFEKGIHSVHEWIDAVKDCEDDLLEALAEFNVDPNAARQHIGNNDTHRVWFSRNDDENMDPSKTFLDQFKPNPYVEKAKNILVGSFDFRKDCIPCVSPDPLHNHLLSKKEENRFYNIEVKSREDTDWRIHKYPRFSSEDKPLLIADHLIKGKNQHNRVVVNFNGKKLFLRCVSQDYPVNFEEKYKKLN
jgi:hypothetical protein